MSAFTGIETVLNRFAQLESAASDFEEPTLQAGEYMLSSIARNFEAQGRPKWQPLAASTLANKKGDRILFESGSLEDSVTKADALDISGKGFSIETDKVQAARLHFGYEGGAGRGHAKTPARPFLLFQDEDADAILTIFNQHFAL